MKKNLLLIFLVLSAMCCYSQVDEVWNVVATADDFEIDKLGNIYLVKDNVVGKYDADMNFVCSYDNYSAGTISSLDVANPFKVIVFYSEYNKLIYLDSKLSELRSPILVDDAGFYNVQVVCSSSFGGFWIFDEQNSCVRRIGSDLSTTQQGTSLYEELGDANVVEMQETISYIFLMSDNGKILVLDKFGNFYRSIEAEACEGFCVDNDLLYCNEKSGLVLYDLASEKNAIISGKIIGKFGVKHDLLYVLSENRLTCNKIKIEKKD